MVHKSPSYYKEKGAQNIKQDSHQMLNMTSNLKLHNVSLPDLWVPLFL